MRPRCPSSALAFSLAMSLAWSVVAEEKVDFNRDVRPILSDKCFQCHGPDEESRQGDLRLDIADEEAGPFRVQGGTQAIKPGDLQASTIWHRLTTDDEYEAMPPQDSHKEPLTDEQKSLIKQWILEGAEYEDFSFVEPKKKSEV